MTTAAKPTAKQKLIANILGMANNTYSQADCEEMKMQELKELLVDLKKEAVTPEPELNADGNIVVHEPTVKVNEAPAKRSRASSGEKGPSKREVLYAAFDKAHAEGADLKAAAKAASPETTDGVVASYLCYWRKDRNVASTRSFGNTAPKLTQAQRVLKNIAKVYGEDFDINVVIAELQAEAAKPADQEAE